MPDPVPIGTHRKLKMLDSRSPVRFQVICYDGIVDRYDDDSLVCRSCGVTVPEAQVKLREGLV